MIMTLILISSKLVHIPKNADLWKNICHATLSKSHFCIGNLQCIEHVFLSIHKDEVYLWKQKSVIKLVSLIVSHTKLSKLYFYKCAHFLLFLSLSILLIHQFHSYSKIVTLIPLIPTPNCLYSYPYSPHYHPDSSNSYSDSLHSHPHSHPDSRHSHDFHADSPHSVPRFPFPKRATQTRRWF